MCAFLDRDLREQSVQIAHISRKASDSSYGNLAALCTRHHDEYDSKRSQTKGYTPGELRHYKQQLIELIASWETSPHQLVTPHAFASALQPSCVPPTGQSFSAPVTSIANIPLDPFKLREQLLDAGERTAALTWLHENVLLSPLIKDIPSIDLRRHGVVADKSSLTTLAIGNESEWNFDVLVFHPYSTNDDWKLLGVIHLQGQKGHKPLLSFIKGSGHSALSVDYLGGSGTGVSLKLGTVFRIGRSDLTPLFTYPMEGYVVGWRMPFQRHFESHLVKPESLVSGAQLGISLKVRYLADPSREQYQEMPLFEFSGRVILKWHSDLGYFIPTQQSTISFKTAEDVFTESCDGFLCRFTKELMSMARSRDTLKRQWVGELLTECKNEKIVNRIRTVLDSYDSKYS